jgi:c-di-GMP-binding flagellar brake protein YcgR
MQSFKIKPGDKIRISAENGYFSENSLLSRIGDIIDQHILLINTPISGRNINRLHVGEEYSFLFYTQDGLLQAKGKIIEYFKQNNVDLTKIEIGQYQDIQRRFFYRLDYILNFTFTEKNDLTNDGKTIPVYKGIIRNISGGGLCFISDQMLMLNEHILCKLSLNCPDFTVEGRILSIELPENSELKYLYRLEFIDIESELQEQIVRYVIYMQREMIKKIKLKSEL